MLTQKDSNQSGFTPIKSGFTLIELLISIAIIGILTAFGTFAFQNAFGKARDAQRRNDLKQLQTALQAYFNDYGKYPSTEPADGLISGCYSSPPHTWCGESSYFGTHTLGYIPGLVPKYIRRLPNDPRAGKANTVNYSACTGTTSGYVYTSDGTDYKLDANCTVEQSPLNNPKDALFDPAVKVPPPGTYNWSVYSDGAAGF